MSTSHKEKIIRVLQLFQTTDEKTPMNAVQISQKLEEEYGMENVHRTSIYDDVRLLQSCGYPIKQAENSHKGWYMEKHLLEDWEIKLMLDLVQQARCVSVHEANEIRNKLLNLTSQRGRSRFSHMIMPLPGNVRGVGQIGEYIEIMLEAMYLHKKIRFQYTEINNAMEKVLRKEGKMYQLNLYTIYWSDNNYYLIGSHDNHDGLTNYRLDRMETKSAQYQKVPLNWFIYSVKDKSNNMNILMKDFMTITANLYIYSFLFTLSPSKKSKKNIDHSLYNVLNEDVDIKQIINIVKELRKKQVENVQIPENCRSFDVLSNLYTIMDCFKVKENRFDVTYHNHGGQLYTLEHFIVPDNRNAKIKWLTKDEESIEISFTGQSERKKKLINYLIVEQKLNNDILLDFDVIKKIELISDYYGNATPKHVGIITAHIENMESYKELKKLKNEEDEKEVENIRNCYNSFLDEYFSDNNQRTILNKLLEGLKLTFINS